MGLGALLFVFAGAAIAHGTGGETEIAVEGPPQMDCEHPPQDAVREAPDELREWIALDCVFDGTSIVAPAEWIWRYPGSFFNQPTVTAGMAEMTERRHDGPWYFKRVEKIKLSEEARAALHQQLAKDIPLYGDFIQKLHALVQVNTVNNYDEVMTLNLAFDSSGHVMGVPCTTSCRPEHAFYMERRK
jgi:hypothetical protein